MRTFVMGDVHGAWKAMKQCLERSQFDYANDQLIQLGDVTDGHDEVYQCVEELLRIQHLVAIRGNHDDWFNEYLHTGFHPDEWRQGGQGTASSYMKAIGNKQSILPTMNGYFVPMTPAEVPEHHRTFFQQQRLYFIDERNNCYVHAGFNREQPFEGQSSEEYMWDRQLWSQALSFKPSVKKPGRKPRFKMVTSFHEIFIGHTPTLNWQVNEPMQAANIWNMDTGAGHGGKLTIMDVDSKQCWQSDPVSALYKPVSG